MEQPGRWQTVAGFDLLWRDWDDGHVVYHSGSGDTHLLDAAAAGIVRRLQQSPAVPAELSPLVTESLGLAPEESLSYTEELLMELERLGLVERCT